MLLINCLMFLPLVFVGSVLGLCFVMHEVVFFLVCNHFDEEEGVGCFALIIFLVPCTISVL